MKELLNQFNKTLESKARLGIMSALYSADAKDFTELKQLLGLTDGNLSSHLSALEKAEYLEVKKGFLGKKPHTTYTITKAGKKAFEEHLNALEQFLRMKT